MLWYRRARSTYGTPYSLPKVFSFKARHLLSNLIEWCRSYLRSTKQRKFIQIRPELRSVSKLLSTNLYVSLSFCGWSKVTPTPLNQIWQKVPCLKAEDLGKRIGCTIGWSSSPVWLSALLKSVTWCVLTKGFVDINMRFSIKSIDC